MRRPGDLEKEMRPIALRHDLAAALPLSLEVCGLLNCSRGHSSLRQRILAAYELTTSLMAISLQFEGLIGLCHYSGKQKKGIRTKNCSVSVRLNPKRLISK